MDEVATMSRVIELTGSVVDGIEPSQLDNPSPCEAWTVRDVLNHVTGGAELFATLRARRVGVRRAGSAS